MISNLEKVPKEVASRQAAILRVVSRMEHGCGVIRLSQTVRGDDLPGLTGTVFCGLKGVAFDIAESTP